jgi:zinc D-Ala-D-Ala carboxypeptidase
MRSSEPARPSGRRIPTILGAGLLAVVAAVFTTLTYQILAPSSSTAASPVEALRRDEGGALGEAHGGAPGTIPERTQPRRASGEADGLVADGTVPLRREQGGALSEADGLVPDGTTVFDDGVPGVANLDPALLAALHQAATDAAANEIVFIVESGWRSAE